MNPYQFWHEDTRLLEVYCKAYYNNLAMQAYAIGARVYEAHSIALNNAFEKKKLQYDKKEPDIISAYNEKKYIKSKQDRDAANSASYQKRVNSWI